MKRDDELIRHMLIQIEADPAPSVVIGLGSSSEEEEEKQLYHAQLLCDAGLLHETGRCVYRLTNDGHDYISAIRSDTIWTKTKSGAKQLGGVSLGMMSDIAKGYLKQEAKEKLGLDL